MSYREIHLRAGDTEPLDMDVSATGLTTLVGATVVAYFRERGASSNHVNGAACTLVSGLRIRFDPVGAKNPSGNAFDAAGTFYGHVKITSAGGKITRYPGDPKDDLVAVVSVALG